MVAQIPGTNSRERSTVLFGVCGVPLLCNPVGVVSDRVTFLENYARNITLEPISAQSRVTEDAGRYVLGRGWSKSTYPRLFYVRQISCIVLSLQLSLEFVPEIVPGFVPQTGVEKSVNKWTTKRCRK